MAGQVRGIPVVKKLRMLGRYDEAELQAAVLNAVLAAFITSPLDHEQVANAIGTPDDAELSGLQNMRATLYGDTPINIDGVRINFLAPGDKPEFLDAKHPNAVFEHFVRASLRNVASAVGLSYEQLSMDWGQVNYSSARAALIEVWRGLTARRDLFAATFMGPIYAGWRTLAHRDRAEGSERATARIRQRGVLGAARVLRSDDTIYGAPVSVHPMWRKKSNVSATELHRIVAELNVRVMGGSTVSGVTFSIPGAPPLIVVNQTQPSDRMRFTLCHELAHVIMHRFPTPNMEEEADAFASAFLVPTEDFKPYVADRKVDLRLLAALKPEWRVSMAALVFAARRAGAINDTQAGYLWK